MKINTCLLALLFVFLFFSCTSLTPEERMAKEKTVQDTYDKFIALEKLLAKFTEYAKEKKDDDFVICDANKTPNAKHLSVFHIGQLSKFKETDSEKFKERHEFWEEGHPFIENEWRWMSTARSNFAKFNDLPASMSNKSLVNAEGEINKTYSDGSAFFQRPEMAIIVPDDRFENKMPNFVDDETFESGSFTGFVFIMNLETTKLVCVTKFSAENSDEIEYRDGKLSQGGDHALEKDFRENVKTELSKVILNYNTGDLAGF